ncbi:MAG: hypothetical protein OXE52_05045 [Chloroflexi bacterium]|nr:hypothetical protein [Chloroflexota bacterium]
MEQGLKVASLPNALDYLMAGYGEDETLVVLARSEDFPVDDAAQCRKQLALEPMTLGDGGNAPALAFSKSNDERAMLVYAWSPDRKDGSPCYQYVSIPYELLRPKNTGIQWLLEKLPLDVARDGNSGAALTLPDNADAVAKTSEDRFGTVMNELLDKDFDLAMILAGAFADERKLMIRNFPADFEHRLDLVAGLRGLLPEAATFKLTFSTSDLQTRLETPHVVFSDSDNETRYWTLDWNNPEANAAARDHPYLRLLSDWWREDSDTFADHLDSLEALAVAAMGDGDLSADLAAVAERYWLDQKTLTKDALETSAMIGALSSAAPPMGELRLRYIRKLLENALHNRDVVAGKRVAEELESDARLEAELAGLFDEMLESQPDTVYVFARNRLNHLGIDDKWIPRLQAAARASLEVAIEEGDVPTLISWLELIAHEPLSYQLQDILRDGVLSSIERSHDNGELGIHLILIAARRLPNIADTLYEDESLIAALPAKMSRALRDNSAGALEHLIEESAEYFLLALFHGIETSDEQLVTIASVDYLWTLFASEKRVDLPVIYRPPAMIRLLATQASHQLTDDALDLHLRHVLISDDRELLVEAASHLADRDVLFPRLSALLEDDDFTLDRVLSILNAVSGSDNLAPRDVIDAYFGMLDFYDWEPATQPLMEALARLMAKNHALHVSYRHLWKCFESCSGLQLETATRTIVTHFFQQFEDEEDIPLVVEGIARLWRQGSWSRSLLNTLYDWWREHTHRCTLTQLHRLERELEAHRHLEPLKQILRTALAMRRWMPDRDPANFAQAINAACTLVEHITDAFDHAHLTEIDPHTVRRELALVRDVLSADERHILANNLRNLAHLMTQMAEKRSKPSLIRSDDSIDRQLNLGEAHPHGSIDMMKWVAGYLDGAHNPGDE